MKRLNFTYNKKIFHAWRGPGSAVFLEIGEPTSEDNNKGEISLCLSDSSWEVYEGDDFVLSDGEEFEYIDKYLPKFVGLSIFELEYHPQINSWIFTFSNGTYIHVNFKDSSNQCYVFTKDKSYALCGFGEIKVESLQ